MRFLKLINKERINVKTIWSEVIYRCDGNLCTSGKMTEDVVAGKPRQADKIMEASGWKVNKNGKCYCPRCIKDNQ